MIDPAAFLALDALNSLGETSTGASFATSTGDVLEVSCHGPGVFRFRAGPNTRPDYGLVVGRAKPCTVTQPSADAWTLASGDATLELAGSPLRFRLLWKGKPVAESITDRLPRGGTRLPAFGRVRGAPAWVASIALASGEAVYGLGEKFGPLDKRGQLLHSDVRDAFGVNTGHSSKNVPLAWSPGTGAGAWGVFVNTPSRVTHGIGHPDWSHRSYAVLVADEALDLFLFAASAPAGILDLYTQLTGRAPGVPRWSLGLWMSAACRESGDEAVALAEKLRARKIPCDVLALDGRAAWEAGTSMAFRWDPQRFPDPPAALAKLKSHRLRVSAWTCPYVTTEDPLFHELAQRHYLLTTAYGDPCVLGGSDDPATSQSTGAPRFGIVDFTNPAAFAWWRDRHKALYGDGIDAVESDFGEHVPDDALAFNGDSGARLHNAYPQLHNQCVFDAATRYQPRDAGFPVVWSRAGWSASQRYPLGGSGEPQSDWEGFAASVRGALSLGMSGQPYHGFAVGGSYGAQSRDTELVLRWLQAAVFGSHLRMGGAGGTEPWALGPEGEAIARKWLSFRYRLVPYLERAVVQATRTGLPVMRAMPLAFPGNALTRRFETQFLCGEAILVAPIVAPGGEVEIALPPGAWYDLNTRVRYAGRQVLRYRAALDQFPAFGREGHALPLGRAVQHTGEIDAADPLDQLWVFGTPANSLDGFTQARIEADGDGGFTLRMSPGVEVVRFGA